MAEQTAPLYKFTQLPRATTTDTQSAYFGAQAQKTRRDTQLGTARADLDAGKINLDSFQQIASRVLGNSVGLPERASAISTAEKGLSNKVQTDYNTLTAQYEQGQKTYEEYIQGVKELGGQLDTNVASNPDFVASTEPIENYKIGDYTVGDILAGAKANYLVQQENQKADDYSKGKISFEDYSSFLKDQLNFYADTTAQDETLSRAWQDAFNTELGRYYSEVTDKYNAGQMTEKDYAQFLDWYGTQVNAGPQETTTFTEFTPKGKTAQQEININKDLSTLSKRDLEARLGKQQANKASAKSNGNTERQSIAQSNIDALKKELNSRKKK